MSQLFTYKSQEIRTITKNGETWFVAKDVCQALGMVWNGNTTLLNMPENWRGVSKFHTHRGEQTLITISEPAVYKLAFRSNKPEADAFTNWVASEVLPSIRKTGKFEAKNDERTKPAQAELPPAFAFNLREPEPGDRYHAYLERVEAWRKAVVAERERLHDEGISLIDADRVGRIFFHVCADYISEWLEHTVISKISVFDKFLTMHRAPVILIKCLNQSFESVNAYLK